MSRYRASLIHLLISTALVGGVFAIVYWVWYPKPTFEVAGAFSIVRLLIVVDLVLGPLLTLVVFKQGKRGLKFDLTLIAIMQVVALIYGSYRLYDEKPQYMVFAIDRVEFLPTKQIDQSAIRYDELRQHRVGEINRVFARRPEDPEEFQRFMDSVMFEGKPDLESRAEYWEPWLAGADAIRGKITPLEDIKPANPREQDAVQNAFDEFSGDHPNLGVLPVGGIDRDIGLLLDRDTLDVLGILHANPWTPAIDDL